MNIQLPIPSFEDIRKLLQFWIDQQDSWFYFEEVARQSGSTGEAQAPNPLHSGTGLQFSFQDQTIEYIQTRIVGKVGDVVTYPPSLLLIDAQVFTALLSYRKGLNTSIVSSEVRPKYGLVFSQIAYYEPIEKPSLFLRKDPRVSQ
jgi:hypothetical protein